MRVPLPPPNAGIGAAIHQLHLTSASSTHVFQIVYVRYRDLFQHNKPIFLNYNFQI